MNSEIKIYRVTDYDWCAAASPEEANKALLDFYDGDYLKEYGETPREVSAEEMQTLIYMEDDDIETKKTFRQKLDELIAEGQGFPRFFATTEW